MNIRFDPYTGLMSCAECDGQYEELRAIFSEVHMTLVGAFCAPCCAVYLRKQDLDEATGIKLTRMNFSRPVVFLRREAKPPSNLEPPPK